MVLLKLSFGLGLPVDFLSSKLVPSGSVRCEMSCSVRRVGRLLDLKCWRHPMLPNQARAVARERAVVTCLCACHPCLTCFGPALPGGVWSGDENSWSSLRRASRLPQRPEASPKAVPPQVQKHWRSTHTNGRGLTLNTGRLPEHRTTGDCARTYVHRG